MIFPYLKKPVKNTYPDSDPFGVKSRTDFLELIKILLRCYPVIENIVV